LLLQHPPTSTGDFAAKLEPTLRFGGLSPRTRGKQHFPV
jgi:hypothetical protein